MSFSLREFNQLTYWMNNIIRVISSIINHVSINIGRDMVNDRKNMS